MSNKLETILTSVTCNLCKLSRWLFDRSIRPQQSSLSSGVFKDNHESLGPRKGSATSKRQCSTLHHYKWSSDVQSWANGFVAQFTAQTTANTPIHLSRSSLVQNKLTITLVKPTRRHACIDWWYSEQCWLRMFGTSNANMWKRVSCLWPDIAYVVHKQAVYSSCICNKQWETHGFPVLILFVECFQWRRVWQHVVFWFYEFRINEKQLDGTSTVEDYFFSTSNKSTVVNITYVYGRIYLLELTDKVVPVLVLSVPKVQTIIMYVVDDIQN